MGLPSKPALEFGISATFASLMLNPQDLHPYVYVGNNPVNRTDPFSLLSCNGEWKLKDEVWSGPLCVCYWLCEPCGVPVWWGGNPRTLPSTTGSTIWDPKTSKYICLCDKPGPEKDCDKCERPKIPDVPDWWGAL